MWTAPAPPAALRAPPGLPLAWQPRFTGTALAPPVLAGVATGSAGASHLVAHATTHPATQPTTPASDGPDFSPGDTGFLALCRAFRGSGGLARQTDAAHCLAGRGQGDADSLAAQVAIGQVFTLPWQGDAWLPMFQLDPQAPARCQGAHQALAELSPVLDGWGMAGWLARGNAWLAGQRPFDLLTTRLPAVLAAARADRFVARG